MARASEARSSRPDIEGRILDLAHAEIVADPVAAVESIYARFELPLSDEHRLRIGTFLAGNPAASRLGKHKHSPEQFGIDPDEVRERLAVYYERYGHLLGRA